VISQEPGLLSAGNSGRLPPSALSIAAFQEAAVGLEGIIFNTQ